MPFDLNASMAAWQVTSQKMGRGWWHICLCSVISFIAVWFVVKAAGATDTQLLCAIIATATVALLMMIGWVGMVLAYGLGAVAVMIKHTADQT